MARKRKRSTKASSSANPREQPSQENCYEGKRLLQLMELIKREIDTSKSSLEGFPEKIWIKQQFAIGINEVTRALERMAHSAEMRLGKADTLKLRTSTELQAIFLSCDCNPAWMTMHIPDLAAVCNVPLILIKDCKGGSLRLGELLKIKTAIAVGVKMRGSPVNHVVRRILESEVDPT